MGTLCANQGFDKDSAVKHSFFRTADKGFGLRLDVAVHAGQHKDEFFRRFRNMSHAQVPDYYFMQLLYLQVRKWTPRCTETTRVSSTTPVSRTVRKQLAFHQPHQ
ncbi:hypothetical protein H257_14291 [Aphanomyces astaci]|uniref:Uncharacterized protein n=1 Tax=Aphanomyces astaci TaxID=112090 RepID=W4FT74_APHAT|nr:hypothetical protein H257_14291 [Aphanomyces astaci]ETV70131.1 hypothetical protein H257_14291 [Aphanomyces astaci]|eukprot:XP_009840362.1 hypothetical protein H257_14291 [Aphanomyces astaci]